ncbi:MAG: ribonuclease P protein component [Gammaproteobacteria bacterium]|nr:ribonuclease P protein component [Gammaproteobacteria bacterium]
MISKKIYQSSYASIYFDDARPNKKLKIIIKKKDYSLAVHRNKIKRWIREIFRHNYQSRGYVVVVKEGFLKMGFVKISQNFQQSLSEFNSLKG